MLPELGEIKKTRKKLGITQSELAKQTGVSQSLIAKIEADATVPSYSNAKKLFDYFENLHKKQQTRAKDVMSTKVISVTGSTPIRVAIRTMEKHGVSQLPVINEGQNMGTVSEKNILEKINDATDTEKLLDKNVEEIMEEAMPQISEETPFEAISSLTEHSPGALVTSRGKVVGIITKSDLLKSIISKK